jgi:hypothetical protein
MQALFSACCQIGDEFAKALDSLVSDEEDSQQVFPPLELLETVRGEIRFSRYHVRSTVMLNRLLQFYSTPETAESTVGATSFKAVELLHCFLKINYLHRDSWVIALTGRSGEVEKGNHFWVRVVYSAANPPPWLEINPVSEACHMRLTWECAVLLASMQSVQGHPSSTESLVGCSSPSHPLRDDAFTFQGRGRILSPCQYHTLFRGPTSWAFLPSPFKATYEYIESCQRPILIVIQSTDLDVFGCSFDRSGGKMKFLTFFTFSPTFRKIELTPSMANTDVNFMLTENECGGVTLCASYQRQTDSEPRILSLDLDADLKWCRAAAKGKATTAQDFHFFVGSTFPLRELGGVDSESDKFRIGIEKVEFYCHESLPTSTAVQPATEKVVHPSTAPSDDDDFVVV